MKFNRKILPDTNYTSKFITRKRLHEDDIDFDRYQNIGVINNKNLDKKESIVLNEVLYTIKKMKENGYWTKKDIVDCLKKAIPEMQHEEKEKNLDEKM